jgi:integrase
MADSIEPKPKVRRAPVQAGTGRAHQRADGRWEWRATFPDGKRRSFYGATAAEARLKAEDARKRSTAGQDLSSDKLTVAAFLKSWLSDTAKDRVRPATFESYSSHVRVHIVPAIGKVKLQKLTPQHVNRMLADMTAAGASPATANLVRATLRTALTSAVKYRLVSQNVAGLSDARKQRKQRIRPLELDQIRQFLEFIRDDRLGNLYHVAIATGLRQGELFALRWKQDVDLTDGVLHVRHTLTRTSDGWQLTAPKTDQSERTIKLSQSAIAALRRQRSVCHELQLLAAERWQEHGLVFPSTVGTPLNASNVTHRLQTLLEAAGLPRQRFHDLRHCTASLLLAEGMDLFTVKEILGHSQISLTANTYGHLMRKPSDEAANRLDRALNG